MFQKTSIILTVALIAVSCIPTVEASGEFKVTKVLRKKLKNADFGKARRFHGGSQIDKFYDENKRLPIGKQGEAFYVWVRCPKPGIFIVAFNYEQNDTGKRLVKKAEINANRKGTYLVVFNNIGQDFVAGGRIRTWKVDVLQENDVLTEKKAFLWS
ncbi:MAG: hypothetical protein P9M03_11015 [Candidatus Theseobacter exili]|nr:hypothetical protein [Candidatus Theseobacter exili]